MRQPGCAGLLFYAKEREGLRLERRLEKGYDFEGKVWRQGGF